MDLQELITRGRFLFAKAPERLKVFEAVNGKRSGKEIARITRRSHANTLRDLQTLRDGGLVRERPGKEGSKLRKNGSIVYEKVPLARTISVSYFTVSTRVVPKPTSTRRAPEYSGKRHGKKPKPLPVPTEGEILDVSRTGEDQLYEFKAQGTEPKKVSREIAAMANTRAGGIVIYGIDDDGTIQGTDTPRQKFDQALHNSVRNTISPSLTVKLHSVSVIGSDVLVIVVPPWNRRHVYQFDGRILLRKGTNAFTARPEEVQLLHRGKYVV